MTNFDDGTKEEYFLIGRITDIDIHTKKMNYTAAHALMRKIVIAANLIACQDDHVMTGAFEPEIIDKNSGQTLVEMTTVDLSFHDVPRSSNTGNVSGYIKLGLVACTIIISTWFLTKTIKVIHEYNTQGTVTDITLNDLSQWCKPHDAAWCITEAGTITDNNLTPEILNLISPATGLTAEDLLDAPETKKDE